MLILIHVVRQLPHKLVVDLHHQKSEYVHQVQKAIVDDHWLLR